MAIVSISEAAKLTGKNRRTLQRHIATGKLSKSSTVTGDEGLDISELLRVYGEFKTAPMPHNVTPSMSQLTASAEQDVADTEPRIRSLEKEVESLKKLLEAKQEHIETLKHALLLIEHNISAIESTKNVQEEPKRSFWQRLLG